jgi:hypothetical protein
LFDCGYQYDETHVVSLIRNMIGAAKAIKVKSVKNKCTFLSGNRNGNISVKILQNGGSGGSDDRH